MLGFLLAFLSLMACDEAQKKETTKALVNVKPSVKVIVNDWDRHGELKRHFKAKMESLVEHCWSADTERRDPGNEMKLSVFITDTTKRLTQCGKISSDFDHCLIQNINNGELTLPAGKKTRDFGDRDLIHVDFHFRREKE